MSHEIFLVQQQSHATLTIMLIGGGLSMAVVGACALYWHWKGRHARKAARSAQQQREADRKRRKRGQRYAVPH